MDQSQVVQPRPISIVALPGISAAKAEIPAAPISLSQPTELQSAAIMLESGANPVPQPPQPQNKISLPILSTNNPQGAASSSAIVLLNNEGQNADTEMI